MASVNINDDAFGQMVGAAVMQQITMEQRDTLVKAAITHLLTPEVNNTYGGRSTSPLQKVFNQAIEYYARDYVNKELDNNGEIAAKIKSVVEEGIAKSLTDDREKVVEKIANAVAGIFGARY